MHQANASGNSRPWERVSTWAPGFKKIHTIDSLYSIQTSLITCNHKIHFYWRNLKWVREIQIQLHNIRNIPCPRANSLQLRTKQWVSCHCLTHVYKKTTAYLYRGRICISALLLLYTIDLLCLDFFESWLNHEHERGYNECSPEQRQQWRTNAYRGNPISRTKSNSNADFGAATFDRDPNINDTPERHPLLSSRAWWSVLFSISLCYASVWIHAYGSSSTIPTVEAHSTKSPRAQQPAC